jgi:hypothetical protein
MAPIHRGRYAAEIDGDFVVFLIGARLNKPWLAVPSFLDLGGRRRGMQAMLDYLTEHPEKGLLGYRMGFSTIVQYWRSFEHLEAFARDEELLHREAWLQWYRRDRTAAPGSGTRPSSCGPASTRPSTPISRRPGWPPPAARSR